MNAPASKTSKTTGYRWIEFGRNALHLAHRPRGTGIMTRERHHAPDIRADGFSSPFGADRPGARPGASRGICPAPFTGSGYPFRCDRRHIAGATSRLYVQTGLALRSLCLRLALDLFFDRLAALPAVPRLRMAQPRMAPALPVMVRTKKIG